MDVYGIEMPRGKAATIVDLGANVGFATIALAARHPGARFICAEPDRVSSDLLQRNLVRNGIEAQIFEVAVLGRPGLVSIQSGEQPSTNRVERSGGPQVEALTVSGLLDRAGVDRIDLLKIDIEGSELEVFETSVDWAHRVDAIIGEIHGALTHERVRELLEPLGFTPVPVSSRHYLRDLICLTRRG